MNRREKRKLGKLNRGDKGKTIQIGIKSTPGQVHLTTSIYTNRAAFSPASAREIAASFLKHADEAERMEKEQQALAAAMQGPAGGVPSVIGLSHTPLGST